MVAHAFWDGGLFLAGLALVEALCAHPVAYYFCALRLGRQAAAAQYAVEPEVA
jgi:hypothetical protein